MEKVFLTLLVLSNLLFAHVSGRYHCHLGVAKIVPSELIQKYIDVENIGQYLGKMYIKNKAEIIVLEKDHVNRPNKIVRWWVRYSKDSEGDYQTPAKQKDFTIVLVDDKNLTYSIVIKNGCIAGEDIFQINPMEDVYKATLVVQQKNGKIEYEDNNVIVKFWK